MIYNKTDSTINYKNKIVNFFNEQKMGLFRNSRKLQFGI